MSDDLEALVRWLVDEAGIDVLATNAGRYLTFADGEYGGPVLPEHERHADLLVKILSTP